MSRFVLLSLLVFALACGDDDSTTDEPMEDASVADAGGETDGGSEGTDGGGTMEDGGPLPVDAATPTDAGPPPDFGPSPCEGLTFGAPCRESCPRGYDCIDGACLPGAMRAGCGGFAGATCTTRAFPNCLYYTSSDYGPCLSEEELACACSALTERFDCTGR